MQSYKTKAFISKKNTSKSILVAPISSIPIKLFDTGNTLKTGIVLDYAQLYAKPHNDFNFIPSCSLGFIKGSCAGGHKFAKLLLCGKEWCPDCGADGSMTHKRRVARWWGKVMSMPEMGYMVVTVPKECRASFKNKVVLSNFRTYLKRKLQRMGYDKGLIRYHWAGDDGYTWHPHLNILIEEGYLSKAKMVELKEDLQTWFTKKFPMSLKGKKAKINLWYSYATPGEKFEAHKIHKLKYITRSTFKNLDTVKDIDLVRVLKGYRTTSTWGKWEKDKTNTSALASLEAGKCPHPECRKPVSWEKGDDRIVSRRSKLWSKVILKPLDGGYYEVQGMLPDIPINKKHYETKVPEG